MKKKRNTFNNMKKVTLAAVALIAVGCVVFEACKKEEQAETVQQQTYKQHQSTKQLVVFEDPHLIGVKYDSNYYYPYENFSTFAQQVEQYVLANTNRHIVLEDVQILDSASATQPTLYIAYFDLDKMVSYSNWLPAIKNENTPFTFYYAPGPGLINISVFTCTGICDRMCIKAKGPDGIPYCEPCPDNKEGHECHGETSNVDVIAKIVEAISSIFSPIKIEVSPIA